MKEFEFESIKCKKPDLIFEGAIIHESERCGFGNFASINLNRKGGFFIYLLIEALHERHIKEFKKNTPEFRILTRNDKSYMLINFAPNLPIFEFLFDISIYKTMIKPEELNDIIENKFQIALFDNEDTVQAVKSVKIEEKSYDKFRLGLINAFNNPNFSQEYRVFLIPFYDKSADRWWNIIKEG